MTKDTIAAIATPVGPGGIGIIRVSGPDAKALLSKIFISYGHQQKRQMYSAQDIVPRRIYYGFIVDPETRDIIDEAIVFYMAGPKSYTREDVIEIQSHSGYIVLEQILQIIVQQGIEPAEPGDFTKRAFLNGRIDLGQAEAVIDKINASSIAASRLASQQMINGLDASIKEIMKKIGSLRAKYEAAIEFDHELEDDENIEIQNEKDGVIAQILLQIDEFITRQKETEYLKRGIQISISGIPNAGKSSLLNQLTSKEAAIVSEYPGTTRDVVKEYISIEGISILVSDTAGIHSTEDPIEKMGIERALGQIDSANIVLLVVEGNRELNNYEKNLIENSGKDKTVVVINKIDISKKTQIDNIRRALGNIPNVAVSAKKGDGIDRLKRIIFKQIMVKDVDYANNAVIPNVRQGKILRDVKVCLEKLYQAEDGIVDSYIIADKLGEINTLLKNIAGDGSIPDLYDEIFSQFCIGK